jgi:hypothetical protein
MAVIPPKLPEQSNAAAADSPAVEDAGAPGTVGALHAILLSNASALIRASGPRNCSGALRALAEACVVGEAHMVYSSDLSG